ncbi:MAG: 4Fe-4S binding protein [Treponema sp.]|jgi:NAD-dependent dihydropyrimidine dehydrogenase PreA subunit|nr:4Fe-4S binding protein [Treponema sp.]
MTPVEKRKFFTRFEAPAVAEAVLDSIVTPAEQRLIARLDQETFSAEDLRRADGGADARALYKRGVINYAETGADLFRFSDFYTRLDVFVISEHETYRAFTKETQKNLDEWYFSVYYERLNRDPDKRPSGDAVITCEEALSRVDGESRQAYRAYCDCRVLAGGYNDCAAPLQTCISFRNGVNTSAHRGVSKPISKDEAKRIIIDADNAGLMHTANPHTICNCCTDCCYLSRARKRRGAELKARLKTQNAPFLSWPKVSKRIQADWENCVACGVCEERCPFHLFAVAEKQVDRARCIGCSLCVNACPNGALSLERISQGGE